MSMSYQSISLIHTNHVPDFDLLISIRIILYRIIPPPSGKNNVEFAIQHPVFFTISSMGLKRTTSDALFIL